MREKGQGEEKWGNTKDLILCYLSLIEFSVEFCQLSSCSRAGNNSIIFLASLLLLRGIC